MSQENVGLVRSMYAQFQRGDYTSAEWAHPEIETVMVDGPAPGSWTGVAEAMEGWRDFLSAWEGYHAEAEEYRELDDERVLVLLRRIGRGRRSGIELGQVGSKGAALYDIRDCRVTRQWIYFDRERALADLGLSE
jgi:ketosteroid isomerase-like protein